jgi:endonuclease YncB( thermonuclease family)
VDTPERGMPWANRAKRALSDLVYGKQVRFLSADVDRYDREVALVALGDLSVNLWLIEQGHGWAYRQHAMEPELVCKLEEQARAARRGLWSQPESTWQPPWIWRKHAPVSAPYTPSYAECIASARTPRRKAGAR